ncbi:COG5437 Predicted secreted protein [uncultured Caudovirales phage]|uniref:COG5437 Predicted secreted protein n=1 Tax=uncultured Caudovirales phage TaxID=2100421 RepID=A0A6J5Q4Z5_9CAUD|nr:COG5437 Predicted secreted protein [uncultured Caudovirales phage]CAB4210823.1 COG5437 Predicted secreted protein [uncultured Caudovirales phage]CAB4223334.1 COG5437 Predicted secreted protein [uncultured Caudovirales phage]
MAAQLGRSLLLKAGTGTGAVTIASLRSNAFTVNGETVDVTNKDSAGYRELLGSAGVVSASLSASGLLAGGTFDSMLLGRVTTRSLDLYTVTFGTNTIAGTFQTTSYKAAGEYNGAQTYDLSLESSGSLTVA